MSGILGNVIVLAVLAVVVTLVIRSLWKSHKKGGSCSGDCSNCSSCQHKEYSLGTGVRANCPCLCL